jgi:hypothetical protein
MLKTLLSQAFRGFLLVAFICTHSACSSSSKNLASVSSVGSGRVQMPSLDTEALRDETRVRLFSGKNIGKALLLSAAVIGTGVVAGSAGSAFAQGAGAGAASHLMYNGVGGAGVPTTAKSRAEASEQALAQGMAFQTSFREKFAKQYSAAVSNGMKSNYLTKNHFSTAAPYTVDTVVDWSWYDQEKGQFYVYAEFTIIVKDAQGKEIHRIEDWTDSLRRGAQPATSLEALLSPGVFDSHMQAFAANAGQAIATGLADELGWEE